MYKVTYKIEVELDYATQQDDQQPLSDNRVADMVRQLFYDQTDRYIEQIHASVVIGQLKPINYKIVNYDEGDESP